MANGYVQLPPDSTGKKTDTEELTVGANTVERQRVQIAGAAATEIAPVSATLGLTVTGPLTDTQLRATAVPVSGPLTDTQLRATAVPISAASLPLPSGAATAAKQSTLLDGRTPVVAATSLGVAVEPIVEPAHDVADDANGPVKIGGKAVATTPTAVAASDRTNALFDLDGALVARRTLLGDIASGVAAITDGSSTSVIAAAGAGIRVYMTDVTIANTSASAVTVDIRDGAAGTVKWTFPVPAGGGVTHCFGSPIPFTANTAVCADPSAAASTITVSIGGFKSKV